MLWMRWMFVCATLAGLQSVRAEDKLGGQDLLEIKLTLPKGDTYVRGVTDPVADLQADLTLINNSAKENREKATESFTSVERLNAEEVANLGKMSAEEQAKLVLSKVTKKDVDTYPVNKGSWGVGYIEPQLGPHEVVDFVITKLPDEGETPVEGAKPVLIPRDNKPDHISAVDLSRTKYLAAGESSPVYSLPVGKYYLIREPGQYSIKVVMRWVGNSQNTQRLAESNEEKFRVLPFKVVDQKIDELKSNLETFERGTPRYDYLLYQVKTDADYDEIYAVQRIPVRGIDRWEWTRLCSVKSGTTPQVAQLAPKKVAVLSVQDKGDAGLYLLDFTAPGVKITATSVPVKPGASPKLKVEAGAPSVE